MYRRLPFIRKATYKPLCDKYFNHFAWFEYSKSSKHQSVKECKRLHIERWGNMVIFLERLFQEKNTW